MSLTSFRRKGSTVAWLIWHVIAAVATVAIPAQLFYGDALFDMRSARLPFLTGFGVAYLAAALVLGWQTRAGRTIGLLEFVSAIAAAIGLWALFLVVTKAESARPLLVLMTGMGTISLFLSLFAGARSLVAVACALALLAAGMQARGPEPRERMLAAFDLGPKPVRTQTTLNTALYSVKATFFDRYFDVCDESGLKCDTPRTGGAIEIFGDGFLYATGEGQLHYIRDRPGKTLETRRLGPDIPLNSAEFLAGGANERDLSVFRVMDILVTERGGQFNLYAAHHHWDMQRACFTMRVSKLQGQSAELLAGKSTGAWQSVWDAEPCLPLKMSNGGQKQFGGDGAGGRMLLQEDGSMLVTIGDQQWDGWNWDHAVSQDPASAYGKVMKLDLETGEASVYASGLRNPEGFHRDQRGKLWSTEHGPQGGDELNLIVEGGNYGWPRMTYGNEYGTQDWPLREPDADDDPSLVRPIYAWVPSIGVSNLLSVRGEKFARWKGDYLICSFNRSLFRAHIRDNKVVVLEPIQVRARNGRLRDIVETSDGRIVLLLDLGALAFLEPVDPKATDARTLATRGETLFNGCRQCHRVNDGSDHAVGPDLKDILNRPVAGAAGFGYSDALLAKGGRWTPEALDAFLRDPQAFAPGTLMQIRGLGRPEDRAALLAYLQREGAR